jgi:DNA-binding transcriptional LysR family regulator
VNFKQFSYATVLAREGSFSRAAEVLGISQPSLSQYIKKMEAEAGQALFERLNGDVQPTEAGVIYLHTARRVLEAERQMEIALSDLKEYRTGSLTIGTAPYRAASFMPKIALAFQSLHPGMHLAVHEGTTDELAEGLSRGEYDLALTIKPADPAPFEWEIAFEEELLLAVPASLEPIPASPMPGRKYPAADPRDLSGKRAVMLTEGQYMQKRLRKLESEYRLSLKPAAVVKNLIAQIEMVRSGIGMALVPSGIERFCRASEVSFYSLKEPQMRRTVVVLWNKDRPLSRPARELKDLIVSFPH